MNRERWLLLMSIMIFASLAVYHLRPGWLSLLVGEKAVTVAARPSQTQPASQPAPGLSLPQVSVPTEIVDARTPWGRNPFLTEAEANKDQTPGPDGLKVKAIIVGRPMSVATIDGRTVTVGEKVGEETVVEIRPDSVVLEMDGTKRILKVSESSISIEVKEVKR